MKKNEEYFQTLARFAKAFAHPVRLQILQTLAETSCCYTGDIAEELPIARSTLSQHIKELKEAGLIIGEYTPPKIKYCLNPDNWELAKSLFNDFLKTDNSCC